MKGESGRGPIEAVEWLLIVVVIGLGLAWAYLKWGNWIDVLWRITR